MAASAIVLHNKDVILGEHNDDRNLYFNEISGMWKIEPPSLTFFRELQQVFVRGLQQSCSRCRCSNTKPIETLSNEIQLRIANGKTSPYRMYLVRKLCITLGSISKEGLYDLGFLSRPGFKAHTVVEDKTRIFVRVVLVGDVRFSNTIMSDINGGLQSFSDGSSALKNYSTHPNPAVRQPDIVNNIEDRSDQG